MNIKAKWIEFLNKVATGAKRERTLLTPVGAVIFGLFTTLFVVSALAFDKLLGLPKIIAIPISLYIAAPFLVLGGLVTG